MAKENAESLRRQAKESEKFAGELRRSGCGETARQQDAYTAQLRREADDADR